MSETETRTEMHASRHDDVSLTLTEADGVTYLSMVSAARNAVLSAEIDSKTADSLAAALLASRWAP